MVSLSSSLPRSRSSFFYPPPRGYALIFSSTFSFFVLLSPISWFRSHLLFHVPVLRSSIPHLVVTLSSSPPRSRSLSFSPQPRDLAPIFSSAFPFFVLPSPTSWFRSHLLICVPVHCSSLPRFVVSLSSSPLRSRSFFFSLPLRGFTLIFSSALPFFVLPSPTSWFRFHLLFHVPVLCSSLFHFAVLLPSSPPRSRSLFFSLLLRDFTLISFTLPYFVLLSPTSWFRSHLLFRVSVLCSSLPHFVVSLPSSLPRSRSLFFSPLPLGKGFSSCRRLDN